MGLLQTIVSAPGLKRFAPAAFFGQSEDWSAREPELSLPWEASADDETGTETAAIYLVATQSGVRLDGAPTFSKPFASDDDHLALSEDGYLINSEGQFLLGMPLTEDGRPAASQPEIVRVDAKGIDAIPTSRIRYRVNLASFPLTANADFESAGSELLNKTLFARDPSVQGSGIVLGDDRMKFIERSLSGGTVSVFSYNAQTVHVVFRWAKIGSLRTAGRDIWNLFYRLRRDARAGEVAWKNVGQNFIFAADGRLEDSIQVVPILDMIVDGIRLGNISLHFGPGGVTQFADRSGLVKVLEANADGCRGGAFTGISMSSRGRLFAHYAGNPMRPVADIQFNGGEPWFEDGGCDNEAGVRCAA